MRWLVVHPGPSFSVQDVYTGWVEALRDLGEKVAEYNLDDRLQFYEHAYFPADGEDPKNPTLFRKALTNTESIALAAEGVAGRVLTYRPDVVLIVSAFFVESRVLRAIRAVGARIVILHTESPYEDMRQMRIAAEADLNLLNDPTNIDLFRSIAPTLYAPHAYRPSLHHPGPAVERYVCDLAFIGTGYASRVEFLERMDLSGLDVLLGGNFEHLAESSPLNAHIGTEGANICVDNAETADIYRSARAGLNLYRREANPGDSMTGWSMGPREVEMAACGLFFLRDPRPESDEVFGMLPTFASPEDAGEQLRWWLAHDSERERVAALALEAVAGRTFTRNAQALLRVLNP